MLTWLLIAWVVLLPTLSLRAAITHDRKFDLHHCARDPRDPSTAYCLPKDGCWLLNAEGAAACYRRSEVVPQ